jgi:hypothetical protein
MVSFKIENSRFSPSGSKHSKPVFILVFLFWNAYRISTEDLFSCRFFKIMLDFDAEEEPC